MCRKGLGDRQIDLVLSDMAPSNPGMASVNHDMTLRLVYSVLEVILLHCILFLEFWTILPVFCEFTFLSVFCAHSCA